MNPKSNTTKPTALIAVLGIAILASFGAGFWVGHQGNGGDPGSTVKTGSETTPTQPANLPFDPPAQPANPGMTPAEIAKGKNVPQFLEAPGGSFELVAVVEGEEANLMLTQNLQTVDVQRQQLLALTQKFDRLPADANQQRELLAGEINAARQTLVGNLQFMAENYGYSLQFTYQLVPHVATLNLITPGKDGKDTAKLVHRFEDAESYAKFQKLWDSYVLASVTEEKRLTAEKEQGAAGAPHEDSLNPDGAPDDGATTGTAPEPSDPTPPAPMEPSAEMLKIRKELMAEFQFDPLKPHQIKLEKSALYARPANLR